MNAIILKLRLFFFCGMLLMCGLLHGQICDNKYLSLIYKGSSYDTFTRAIFSKGEIIALGEIADYNNPGHIAKFSANGTPLWSYLYAIDYYSFYPPTFFKTIHLKDIIATADGGYIVAGNFDQVLSPYGLPPPVKKFALLAKIDKFGKVVWNKTLANQGDLGFSNIAETSDGDCIAYLATDNGKKRGPGDHTYGKVLRVGANGATKWSTLLFTFLYDAGNFGLNYKRAITQASNKNIIVGQAIHKTELVSASYRSLQGNLHFLELDYATGKVNWETSYEYPVPPNDTLYRPDIVSVNELADGRFSFLTTLYLSTPNQPALTKKGANIITSNKGKIENIIAYSITGASNSRINDAVINKADGTQTILLNKDGNAVLANTAGNGQISWSRGYDNNGGSFPVNCFSAGKKGYSFFMSNNNSFNTRLLITDSIGVIDCVNMPANVIAEQAAFNFPHDSVVTDITIKFDEYEDRAYPFKRKEEYPLAKNIDCQQTTACCNDFIDSVNFNHINICEGKSYMLPDSTIIKDSGTYYVTFKTPLGCDSIRYYRINTDKDVAKLSLGKDTCLTQAISIKLLATTGYSMYYWVNKNIPDSNAYTVSRPGNYWVTVSNTCGTKTDSINIYDQCDYPAYMPKAFTPNNDNLNDIYRISPLNKNRLISFKIFNRWGKLVFKTSDPHQGWDGSFRNEPLPSDTFVYYLEMEGLSGKQITQKGSFILLR